MPSAVAAASALAFCLLAVPAWASPESAAPAVAEVVAAHLQTRQQALGRQHEAALMLAKQQAWLAYRLTQKRSATFFADPQQRPKDAQAADLAFSVLSRSLDEAAKIAAERREVESERARLVAAAQAPAPASPKPLLLWPAKGPVIAVPGLRTDAVTGVVSRETGVQILARLDAPVACPAAATVTRVERLPAGGHAVVLALAEGWVTVLSGLRVVDVAVGDQVPEGQILGRVGKTLDGAPVLRLALWQGAQAEDPRPAVRPVRAARKQRRPR